MKCITHTDGDRRVVMRERLGRDNMSKTFVHGSLARPLTSAHGVEDIKDLPNEIWGQVVEVGAYVQQIVSLEGDWGDITLPASESDEDRHAFFCALLDAPERYIQTLQAALKEVNASPLNPP